MTTYPDLLVEETGLQFRKPNNEFAFAKMEFKYTLDSCLYFKHKIFGRSRIFMQWRSTEHIRLIMHFVNLSLVTFRYSF